MPVMNPVVAEFIENLSPKVKDVLQGTAKLVIKDQGSVMLDSEGARADDGEADVVMIASEKLFRGILDGSENSAMAFLSGKLKVEGSNMRAIKVSEILTS
jgi:putative sterol carrier protein